MNNIVDDRKKELADNKLFTLEDYLDRPWRLLEPREKFIKGTQSSFLSVEQQKRDEITAKANEPFMDPDDIMDSVFHTTVYMAKKRRIS